MRAFPHTTSRVIGRKCAVVARFRPHASGELAAYVEKGSYS